MVFKVTNYGRIWEMNIAEFLFIIWKTHYYAHTNNIYSLFLARHHLASDDTLLLESDIVFEKRILERVLEEPYPDVAVVDRYKSWMDGTMVTVVKSSLLWTLYLNILFRTKKLLLILRR